MKTKKVNRYYCDFCKKSNCSAPSMAVHEKHCTMNPNRECRMCEDSSLSVFKKMLPAPPVSKDIFTLMVDTLSGNYPTFRREVIETVKLMRSINSCPACLLAALRQGGIPVGIIETFDYKKESLQYLKEKHWHEDESGYY